jgi:hypothetical protein
MIDEKNLHSRRIEVRWKDRNEENIPNPNLCIQTCCK